MNKLFLSLLAVVCILCYNCKSDSDDEIIKVEKISLSEDVKALNINETYTLNPVVDPTNATVKDVQFSSANTGVATVNKKGVVRAIAGGETDITVTTVDEKKTATCHIIVHSKIVNVESVRLKDKEIRLKPNGKQTLEFDILPADATNKAVRWTSSQEDVATVSETGEVTAIAEGEAIITLTSINNALCSECTVTVSTEDDPNLCVDKAGRKYRTVKIGNQIWMAENLAYLPVVGDVKDRGGYYVYGYTGTDIEEAKKTDNYKKHGVMYSFATAKNSCPKGWHIATDEEWQELELFIGMKHEELLDSKKRHRSTCAYKLKAIGGWEFEEGVTPGNDEYGLGLLPSGASYLATIDNKKVKTFEGIDYGTWLFTSTEIPNYNRPEAPYVIMRCLKTTYNCISRYEGSQIETVGSVRCIKDKE